MPWSIPCVFDAFYNRVRIIRGAPFFLMFLPCGAPCVIHSKPGLQEESKLLCDEESYAKNKTSPQKRLVIPTTLGQGAPPSRQQSGGYVGFPFAGHGVHTLCYTKQPCNML